MIQINRQYFILDGKLISYSGKDKRVIIPDEVTSIGEYAFSQTIAKEVVIPGSVRTVGSKAFDGSKIESLYILDGVKNLEAGAFSNCGSLREIHFPSSGLLPISNASSVFNGSREVESIYLDKISTMLFMFLDEGAFPNLKNIYVGKGNVDTFINKLKYKFPAVKFYVDGKIDVEVSSLTSSLINQVEELFSTLPVTFAFRLKRDFKKKMSTVREDELLNNSSVVVEKLQRLIMNFEEIRKLVPLMETIEHAKDGVSKELVSVPMVGNTTTSFIPYVHYVAMKFNDYEISKKLDNILESASRRISEYILNGDEIGVDELVNILSRNLDIEIGGLYNQTKLKYNVPSVGKYVDLLDEIRGEKKSGLFYSFSSYLDKLVEDENDHRKLTSYSKTYQRMGNYEKFITDEIRSIIRGENTRYANYNILFDDLVKDFKNRDTCFAGFLSEYMSYDKVRPYIALVNCFKEYKKENNRYGYSNDTDSDVELSIQRVESLINALDSESRVIYKSDLDRIVETYLGIVMNKINGISVDKKSKDDQALYDMQMDSVQIKMKFEEELSLLVEKIQSSVLESQDTIPVLKSINMSLDLLAGDKNVKTGDRIIDLVRNITLEVTNVDEELALKILELLKITLLDSKRNIRVNRVEILKDKEEDSEQVFEQYVFDRINDIYNKLLMYKDKYLELADMRELFEVKKEC